MEGEATSFTRRQPPPEEPPKTDGITAPTFDGEINQVHQEHPEDWGSMNGGSVLAGGAGQAYFEIETIQKMRTVVDLKEISDPSHHLLENKLDQESRCKGLPNYLKYSWPPQPSHTIFRVPSYISDCDNKAYAPTVVTIGLLHFSTIESQSRWLPKRYKSHCVSYLLARHGNKEKAEELRKQCMNSVLESEPQARSCYSVDDGNVGKRKFAKMLLRDGGFILHLLLKQTKPKGQEVNGTADMSEWEAWDSESTATINAPWIWNPLVYDLLKLENQIPFFVVQKLFDLLKTPADKDIDLVERALEFLSRIYPARATEFEPPRSSDVLHLLHLFHSSLIPPNLKTRTVTGAPDWIPCATVLQDSGIRFQPPKNRTPNSFLDVKFENGVMEIPPLQVDDRTSVVFRNLIAFEQCYPKTTTHITSYARFIDDLLNTRRDVELLRFKGVLLNRLGTEEAAVDLLNKLCDQVHHTPQRNYLGEVINAATEYSGKRKNRWLAELFKNYLSNPWVIISVLAAGVLLLLTIEQAVFAALSYLHP